MTKLKSIAVKNSEYTFFKKGNAYIITFITTGKDGKLHLDKLHFFDECVAEGVWADIVLRTESIMTLKKKGA